MVRTIKQFIQDERIELLDRIEAACPNVGVLDDDDIEQWILNDEDLYNWALSEGVDI